MNSVVLWGFLLFLLPATIIVVVLNILQSHKNKTLKDVLNKLEYEKNVIDSTPITPELSKIESYLKNEKLETMYNDWKERLAVIKNTQVPKLTDMILDAEYSLSQQDYKSTLFKIAKLEMEVYKVRTNSEFLLNEIKEITTSEEKNRAIITSLKSKYRNLYEKFTEQKNEYGEISKSVSLQFENIAHRFEEFETTMENNEYTEVTQIIKAIDDMLTHMEFVVEEIPGIVLLANTILPKKIKEIEEMYQQMSDQGFQLDYLNVEYNIEEANKKIEDVMSRSKVLNLEDSTFELKVLLDYLDSLFNDFEKEQNSRSIYEEAKSTFTRKLENVNELVNDIFAQINDIQKVYNLSEEDMKVLNEVRQELVTLNEDYNVLLSHTGNHTFAFSKLTSEVENLVVRLNSLEDRLDNSLDAIGNMREDEARARQQLEEIKVILKDARNKIHDYNLPVIPKFYYTELNEASAAIKEIIKELEQKPITISVLNTRVDTARDLAFKLYSRTKELIKIAAKAEIAIVYGNRYRTSYEEMDKYLTNSEMLFYKGEYQKSLELTLSMLTKIEPNIIENLESILN